MSEEPYEVSIWLMDGTRMRFDVMGDTEVDGCLFLRGAEGNSHKFNLDNIVGYSSNERPYYE